MEERKVEGASVHLPSQTCGAEVRLQPNGALSLVFVMVVGAFSVQCVSVGDLSNVDPMTFLSFFLWGRVVIEFEFMNHMLTQEIASYGYRRMTETTTSARDFSKAKKTKLKKDTESRWIAAG